MIHLSCLPLSMSLGTVAFSCLARFLLLLFFLFATCCKIQIYCLPLVWVFEFTIFIICFPVECQLLHDGSTYLGCHILHSIIVVCSHHSNGPYFLSYCCNHCLGYCLHYSILLSCQSRILLYLLWNCFCKTALFQSAYLTVYVKCLFLPSWHLHSWHCIVYLALTKITLVDAYMCIYCCAFIRIYIFLLY